MRRSVVYSVAGAVLALALVLTVFGFNLLGDGIRDALDPRLNR